jgi:hypothetical protein
MVSPPYKEGALVAGRGVADDGNGFLYTSSGAFSDTESVEALGGEYYAERTGSGWQSTSHNPPASMFPAALRSSFDAASAFSTDLRSTMMVLQDEDFAPKGTYHVGVYVRGPDGNFNKVSPSLSGVELSVATNALIGTSDDLTRYLLNGSISADIAPTDGTIDSRTGGSIHDVFEVDAGPPPVIRQIAVDNAGATLEPACPVAQPNGTKAGTISQDGSRVLVQVCSGTATQLYSRVDQQQTFDVTGSQCEASRPAGACNAASVPTLQGVSTDGQRVVFSSSQQLVSADVDTGNDLYMCDVSGTLPAPTMPTNKCPDLVPITVTGTSTAANVVSVAGVSNDASRVYFVAKGVLAGANSQGAAPALNASNLYVWEPDPANPGQQRTVFIGPVNSTDFSTCPSSCTDWVNGNSGESLVFATALPLIPSDTDVIQDVYEYDAESNELQRMWVTDAAHNGTNRQSPSTLPFNLRNSGVSGAINQRPSGTVGARPSSEDGSIVFFTTAEGLVPRDTNEAADVYEWHDGTISLISDGKSPSSIGTVGGLALAGTDPSGDTVFFNTTSPLLNQDTDTATDTYAARIDGGFPPPAGPVAECDALAGACQSGSTVPPVLPGAASSGFTGPGNAKQGPGCGRYSRQAGQFSQRAKRTRRAASRALSKKRTKGLRRQAKKQEKHAKSLRQRGKQCKRGGSGK